MDTYKIHISPGNMKLGKIPSLSLPPIITCRKDAPCLKKCYAMKAWRLYPNCHKAWNENLDLYNFDIKAFFDQLSSWLTKHKPEYFRWHVSGDIPDKTYAFNMNLIAKKHPNTKFLCLTKKPHLVDFVPAENLIFRASEWAGLDYGTLTMPKAIVRLKGDSTALQGYQCKGDCSACRVCWDNSVNVIFDEH